MATPNEDTSPRWSHFHVFAGKLPGGGGRITSLHVAFACVFLLSVGSGIAGSMAKDGDPGRNCCDCPDIRKNGTALLNAITTQSSKNETRILQHQAYLLDSRADALDPPPAFATSSSDGELVCGDSAACTALPGRREIAVAVATAAPAPKPSASAPAPKPTDPAAPKELQPTPEKAGTDAAGAKRPPQTGSDRTAALAFHRTEASRLAALKAELGYSPNFSTWAYAERPVLVTVASALLYLLLWLWLEGQREWVEQSEGPEKQGKVAEPPTGARRAVVVLASLSGLLVLYHGVRASLPDDRIVRWWSPDGLCHSPSSWLALRAALAITSVVLVIGCAWLWQLSSVAQSMLVRFVELPPKSRATMGPPAAGARPPKGGSAHAPAPGGGAKPTAAPTAWAAALAIEFLRRTPPRLFLLLCGTVLAFTAYARFVGVIVPDHRSSYLLAVFAAVAVWLVFLWRFFSVASAVQDAWLKAGRPSLSLAPKAGEQWDPMKEIVDKWSTELVVYLAATAAALWTVFSNLQLDVGLGLKP